MAAAPVRAWLVVLVLACALLLLAGSAGAAAAAPAPQSSTHEAVSSGAKKPKCVPGGVNDKACRVGAVHDPENQEEEGFSVAATKAPTGAPDSDSDDDYNDPDEPNDDQLVVVGH